jgi:hypothetical protein
MQNSQIPITQSPLMLTPHSYHGTFVNTMKLTLVPRDELKYRLYLGFTSFSTHVVFLFQDPVQSATLHLAV